jgi:nitrite reductase/ring-hydroxylating ferredoxin subunit
MELEKLTFAELSELAADLAQEDERIKLVRGYFLDEIRSRAPKKVIRQDDLRDGEMAATVHNGASVILAKAGGEIFALENSCPHQRFPLHHQGKLKGYTITCGFHGGQFDIRTGACVKRPAETYRCAAFRVRSTEDGTIVCEPRGD